MQVEDEGHGGVSFAQMLINDVQPELLEDDADDDDDAAHHLELRMSCPPPRAPECHAEVVEALLKKPPVPVTWLPSDLGAQLTQEKKAAAERKKAEQAAAKAAKQVAKDAAAAAKAEKVASAAAAKIAKSAAKLMPKAPPEEIAKVAENLVPVVLAEEEQRKAEAEGGARDADDVLPKRDLKDRLVC